MNGPPDQPASARNDSRLRVKVLIIDDEPQIRRLLKLILEVEGYNVRVAEMGVDGLTEAAFSHPDLIILDLGLPDISGIEVLKRLREWSKIPVLVLSVRTGQVDKTAALDTGADDYLTKPFDPGELFARLRALRRRLQAGTAPAVVRFGSVQVDLNRHIVTRDGREVRLTTKEYALLNLLLTNRGKVLTHRHILRTLWGPRCENQMNYLRVYMVRLRQKLEDNPNQPKYLVTASRFGYRLTVPDAPPGPPAAEVAQ
jgi:two-component system KDP operon response regulator KdpE